jgi:hypothetical protein
MLPLDREVARQRSRSAITIVAGESAARAARAKFPVLHRGERSCLKALISGGFGGVTPIGASEFYLYGAATAVSVAAMADKATRPTRRCVNLGVALREN